MIGSDFENQTLLVIAPPPDDETLGCGGTIAKIKDLGGKVYVLIVCLGNVSQYYEDSIAETRIDEMRAVMEFLGIDGYDIAWVGEEHHLMLDTIPMKVLIDLIENKSKVAINKINPTVVALPFEHDYNQDHAAIFKAGFAACRPIPDKIKSFPKLVLSYEQPATFWSSVRYHPNLYQDIGNAYLDLKLEALALYKSQIRPNPHPRSIEGVKTIAKLRGTEICVEAAEAFICHRMIIGSDTIF
jgi:LmbE family N-acetylglucosaminyl deacetylase